MAKIKSQITQKELNERLIKCGYGYSLFPVNWWSKEDLEKVERREMISFKDKLKRIAHQRVSEKRLGGER